MGLLKSCFVLSSVWVALIAVLIGLVITSFPPDRYVDSCQNEIPGDHWRSVQGLPFKCGWQEVRPGSGVHAYLQPYGSFCWSNAGAALSSSGEAVLVVDTLTDPALTNLMLGSLPGGAKASDLQALVYTHGDIDHIFGDQTLPPSLKRYGSQSVNKEIEGLRKTIPKMRALIYAGHYVWSLADTVGVSRVVSAAPPSMQPLLLKVLGWGLMQSKLARFHFDEVDAFAMKGVTEVLPDGGEATELPLPSVGKAVWKAYGGIHSKMDAMLFLPDKKIVFTGDLLFIGIAPVMWGGPASQWVTALDSLINDTGKGWLFVPGHGPVTDVEGVTLVRDYFQFLHDAVSSECAALPEGEEADGLCARKVYAALPDKLRVGFVEGQRILISAAIERKARRTGHSVEVQVPTKVKLLAEQGEEMLRQQLGLPHP
mmetsp:Transcript_14580/g.34583  ORF Transcript_14580/g.34583 Transcript_14580/m.34583 type:complete len:426 (-) Transcript_14580:383-1660(-)